MVVDFFQQILYILVLNKQTTIYSGRDGHLKNPVEQSGSGTMPHGDSSLYQKGGTDEFI